MTAVMPNLGLQNSSPKIKFRWDYTSALSVGVCQIDDSCIELKAQSTAASVAVDSLLQYAWKLILTASRGNWDYLKLNLKSQKTHISY